MLLIIAIIFVRTHHSISVPFEKGTDDMKRPLNFSNEISV
jgi:hypothetical protein